jgi:hypothetical protein
MAYFKKSTRMTAEEQFQATQKKIEKARSEQEQAAEERSQKIDALRARRLAQEAADKKSAKPTRKRQRAGTSA